MTEPRTESPRASDVEAALTDARKALRALYLAVDSTIAGDIGKRVEAAFAALRTDQGGALGEVERLAHEAGVGIDHEPDPYLDGLDDGANAILRIVREVLGGTTETPDAPRRLMTEPHDGHESGVTCPGCPHPPAAPDTAGGETRCEACSTGRHGGCQGHRVPCTCTCGDAGDGGRLG